MKEIFVTLLFTVDEDVTVAECKEYALTAALSHGGGRDPTDPFFGENKQVRIMKAGRHKEPRRLKQQKPKTIPWD